MIQKAIFKECELLENTRYAPYAGYTVFIVDSEHLIFEEEIVSDFDIEEHFEIFEIVETVE